jgi:D-alanyl-D-alanine carboxypeptidase/D-alanyl-D-alanine-endopeptidase (penicillin-binding protein 4)
VLALLAGAGAAYRFDLGARWFGTGPDPTSEPAEVAPPEGLSLPALTPPPRLAAAGARPARLDAGAVRRTLAPFLADRDLGRHVLVAVADLATDRPLVTVGSGAAIPASLTKLLTVTAALEVLGPDHVFTTSVQRQGRGRIVLVGGGDPLLASEPDQDPDAWPAHADVVTLARATARALEGQRKVRLTYDDSLFTGPAVNPSWPDDYVPDGVVSPITALWVDQGRAADGYSRVADPSASAAQAFADALEAAGVQVQGRPVPGRAPRTANELASVESAPLALVAERVVLLSDNEGAEVLARHVGLASDSGQGSSAAGMAAVVETLRTLGVRTDGARLLDGSGLSRRNLLDPDTLVDVVQLAADPAHPELRPALSGLPVAGFSGSLAYRDGDARPPARGLVRAKTGTLTGVTGLAGIATRPDGSALAFALLADRVALLDTLDARQAFDELAVALATCACTA